MTLLKRTLAGEEGIFSSSKVSITVLLSRKTGHCHRLKTMKSPLKLNTRILYFNDQLIPQTKQNALNTNIKHKIQTHKNATKSITWFDEVKKDYYQTKIGSGRNKEGSARIIQVNTSTNKSSTNKNDEHSAHRKSNHSHHQVNPRRYHH